MRAAEDGSPSGFGPAHEQRLALELLRSRYQIIGAPLISGLLVAIALGGALWWAQGQPAMLVWIGAKVLLAIVRLLDKRAFQACADPTPRLDTWRARHLVLMMLDAASWGVLAAIALPIADSRLDALLAATVLVVAATSIVTLLLHWQMAITFAVLAVGPAALAYAL